MKKNTTKLVVIITLIFCTITLLGCGIFVACDALRDNKPNTPLNSVEDDDYWTNNY